MLTPQFVLPIARELLVDLFAGGGGASTGIEAATGRHVDIAINHDPEAIALHSANHPQTRHFVSDVFEVDPIAVTDGQPVGLLWASPDCKHFSKAKGGKPVSKKIRGLAWVVVEWAKAVRPRIICLENVEEFQTWGPLLDNGLPDPARKGETFREWKAALVALGYNVEHRELRASEHKTPTIRKRFFLVARCDGQPIEWPTPTTGKPDSLPVRAKKLKPWRTAAECIDWSIPCPSIFDRKKPLAEATLRRVAKGIMRYVVESNDPFLVPLTHQGGDRTEDIRAPFNTVTGANRGEKAVIVPTLAPFMTEHANASTQRVFPADEPLRTQCAQVKGGYFAMVAPTLIQTGYGERASQAPRALDIHAPLGTVVSGQKHALITAFMAQHNTGNDGHDARKPVSTIVGKGCTQGLVTAHITKFRTGSVGHAANEPLHTVTASSFVKRPGGSAPLGVVAANLVHMGHGEQSANGARRWSHGVRDVDEPLNTVTASGAPAAIVMTSLVGVGGRARQSRPRGADEPTATITSKADTALLASHLVKLRGTSTAQGLDEPLHTVSAQGTHFAEVRAFLIKYYGADQAPELQEPLHTITTKDRFGLVTVRGEEYAIVDIGLRMLTPRELYRAQGFPESYVIDRGADGKPLTKTAQVRMCGNSVCPPLAQAIVAANYSEPDFERVAA